MLLKNILVSESYKKGYLISSFFSLFAKSIGFFTSIILAFYFGASDKTDFYFFCVAFVSVIVTFFSSLNGTILIPEAMRLRHISKDQEFSFLNFLGLIVFIVAAVIVLVCYMVPIPILRLVTSFSDYSLLSNIDLFYLSLPLVPLLTINNLFIDILTSYKYFTVPIGLSAVSNCMIILFVYFFHHRIGVASPVAGWLTAVLLQTAVLGFFLVKMVGWKFSSFFCRLDKKIIINMGIAQAGNLFSMASTYFPIYLLSGFACGALSVINYGQRVSEALNNLLVVQFSSIIGIKLNELFSKNLHQDVDLAVHSALKSILCLLCPVCVIIIVFRLEIITLLFGHGLFKPEDASLAAFFLQLFVATLPFLAMNTLVARLFMAAQKIDKSVVFQIVMGLVNMSFLYVGVRFLKVPGYPVSLLVFYAINTLAISIVVKRNLSFVNYWSLCSTLGAIGGIHALLCIPLYIIHVYWHGWAVSLLLLVLYLTVIFLLYRYLLFVEQAALVTTRVHSIFAQFRRSK